VAIALLSVRGERKVRHMEMFLMVLCMSVLGLALAAMAFGAATRPERTPPATQPQPHVAKAAPHFFVEPTTRVPIEALLLQIENHVRLEHAAAESFVEYPTSAMLHSKTASPLVN
jgi:hypothetical protein